VRRTPGGDAWQAGQESVRAPEQRGVLLGMPTVRS
jgi:hypothetical protein